MHLLRLDQSSDKMGSESRNGCRGGRGDGQVHFILPICFALGKKHGEGRRGIRCSASIVVLRQENALNLDETTEVLANLPRPQQLVRSYTCRSSSACFNPLHCSRAPCYRCSRYQGQDTTRDYLTFSYASLVLLCWGWKEAPPDDAG